MSTTKSHLSAINDGIKMFYMASMKLNHAWMMLFVSSLLKVSYLIFSFFNDSRLLAPKYSEYFTGSALPILYSWSDSPIGCSAPLYSWSGSLIRSAYLFLYINFCFRINKWLRNLTSLRQHHLQYNRKKYLKTWKELSIYFLTF